MPSQVVKSFAEKSGKSESEVEKIWKETEQETKDKFKYKTSAFWAYVNKTVQHKLGLAKESLTFKGYVLLEKESKKESKKEESVIRVGDKVELIKPIKDVKDATVGEVFNVNSIADNGDLRIDNYFGAEWVDTYFSKKLFKKVEDKK